MSDIFSILGAVLSGILYLALAFAFHGLWATPLYRIAKGRGMRAAWLGWAPVISVFLLFAIADDIRRRRRRRAPLLVCGLLAAGAAVIALVLLLLSNLFDGIILLGASSFAVLLLALSAFALYIMLHIGLYLLYTEYKWHNAIAFTVLGVLTPIAIPLFVFFCRDERPRCAW